MAPPTPNPSSQFEESQAWRALAALCVGFFVTLMDLSLVAVALPRLSEELSADVNQSVWVVAIYLLTFATPLLVAGRLGDRFGQRNVYLVGMTIFTVAALSCLLAPSIELLIVARAVQGFGASLVNPQSLSVINRVFEWNRRGAAMGVWSAVAASAGLFGPIIGGILVGTVGWRWVFFVYLPFGFISLVLVARWVPRLPSGVARVDIFSAVLSLIAVFGLVFTLQQGPELGWPVWIWGVFVIGVLALGLFVLLQRRAHRLGFESLVPWELFSYHNFAWGSFSVSTLGFTVFSINVPIMLYLQGSAGLSPQAAGLMLVPTAIVSVILAPLIGRIVDSTPPGRVSMIGFASMIAAMALFAIQMKQEAPLQWMLVPFVLLGTANGICWAANSAISMRQLPAHLVGAGSGVYNTSRQVGAVLGTAALGAMMQAGVNTTDLASAMGNSMFLPVLTLSLGLVAVASFRPDTPTPAG